MPDKTVIKGAQGNFPFGKEAAYDIRHGVPEVFSQKMAQMLYSTPYLKPDLHAGLGKMSSEEFAAAHELVPAGVLSRHGSSFYSPVQVPDLIGVKDRKYLDRTGLVRQRDIGDLMLYAALNQDVDPLSRYGDFRPLMSFVPGLRDKLLPPLPASDVPSCKEPRLIGSLGAEESLANAPGCAAPTTVARLAWATRDFHSISRCQRRPLCFSSRGTWRRCLFLIALMPRPAFAPGLFLLLAGVVAGGEGRFAAGESWRHEVRV